MKGDTHLIVRRPEDCNLFTDPRCRLPLPHLEMTPRLLRDREANFGKLLSDIREQVGLRAGDWRTAATWNLTSRTLYDTQSPVWSPHPALSDIREQLQ